MPLQPIKLVFEVDPMVPLLKLSELPLEVIYSAHHLFLVIFELENLPRQSFSDVLESCQSIVRALDSGQSIVPTLRLPMAGMKASPRIVLKELS